MFDATAHGSDPWSWTSMHRLPIAAAAGAALAGLAAMSRRR
jgi:hypothetical protein